jgi:hypothetical protein
MPTFKAADGELDALHARLDELDALLNTNELLARCEAQKPLAFFKEIAALPKDRHRAATRKLLGHLIVYSDYDPPLDYDAILSSALAVGKTSACFIPFAC